MHFIYLTLFVVVVVQFSLQNVIESKKRYRIYRGKNAEPHSAPYQVALFVNGKDNRQLCGGSLIKPTFVLTAAHCLQDVESIKVKIGMNSLDELNMDKNTVDALNFKRHEHYNPDTIDNDIALVRLRKPVALSNRVALVALPNFMGPNFMRPHFVGPPTTPNYVGQYGKVTGWGVSSDKANKPHDKLKELKVHIVNNQQCHGFKLDSNNLCGYGEPKGSACTGDSGGPLVLDHTNTQIGIVSFGAAQGCALGHPHVYTNVAPYTPWIAKWSI